MKNRTYIFSLVCILLLAGSCSQDIITDVDYYVTLDKSTKFKAGEPVHFKINGDADYLMFYSGEQGHEYRHRNRTEIDYSDIRKAVLKLETYPERYGAKGDVMTFYMSHTFEGLSDFGDKEANMELMQAEIDSGMKNWQKLDWVEGDDLMRTLQEFDLMDYLDHFCIAMHYNPSHYKPDTNPPAEQYQASFNISGDLVIDIDGLPQRQFSFQDLNRSFVFMSRDDEGYPYEYALNGWYYCYDYYYSSSKNDQGREVRRHIPTEGLSDEDKAKLSHQKLGGVGFGAAQGDIRFVGSTANGHHFDADIWVVYDGVKLNSVEKDKGEVVKSLENKINEYSYTYDEPGTYTAVFHGFNVSADVRYDYVVEIPVTITD